LSKARQIIEAVAVTKLVASTTLRLKSSRRQEKLERLRITSDNR